MTIIELIISLAVILGAAALFTNAVEIMGDRLHLGAGAVGSVLAAAGRRGARSPPTGRPPSPTWYSSCPALPWPPWRASCPSPCW